MKCVIISHGHLAEGMKEAVEMIIGPHPNLKALCLLPEMAPEVFREALLREVDGEQDVFVFADLLGGTPLNSLASILAEHPAIRFATGMNLGMCLEVLSSEDGMTPDEAEKMAKDAGQSSIVTCSELFHKEKG